MHCPQLQLEPGQQDTLACEFDGGSRVNAAWDDEGQTASYMLPKVTPDALRPPPDQAVLVAAKLLADRSQCMINREVHLH